MNVVIDELTPEMQAVKARMKAAWNSGDYGTFAKYMEPGALKLLEEWQIPTGARLLDVACGAGQIAIPAARAGAQATGIDIAPNWVEQARARAVAEGLTAQFDEGDAKDLPYGVASFDVVVSVVGAMFAPRPERVAAELVRVCRPGGRIIMVNWTPSSFVGQMFKVIAKHVPPAPGVPSAMLWGNEPTVRERLRDGIRALTMTHHAYPMWNYPFGVPEVVEFFRQNYGPIQRAFAALDAEGQVALRNDLEEVFSNYNRATDGTTSLESEFLEVDAIRNSWPGTLPNERRKPMNLTMYLQKQFANFNGVLHAIAGDLTEEEWLARPVPGQNTLGYTVWHIPRTQDNFLQTWIRGQAEIAHRDRWVHWQGLRRLGVGIGITLEESDEIAHTAHLADTLAYADEVHQTITAWLGEVSEEDLDQVPDARRHLAAFPEYQTPGYLEEVDNLIGLPAWGLLIRPCMGHVHRHLGELEITKNILRKAR